MGGHNFSAVHFTGIMGSGMSALAQFLAWSGLAVSGSDRIAAAEEMRECKARLEGCGCTLYPQDGSGITAATEALVVSSAIEEDNADIAAARKRGTVVLHRSDVLAAIVGARRTIAVCGTSGKSTVTALIFDILRACGKHPSLLTGANLESLREAGLLGNAFLGADDLLVMEADESDGTLVKYRPQKAVFLNVSKDHKSVGETLLLLERLAQAAPWVMKNADDPGLARLKARYTFGLAAPADYTPEGVAALTPAVLFSLRGTEFALPLPGAHNLANAVAALGICASEGCEWEAMAAPLRAFKGVERRFILRRTAGGVTVIDDYAHNPEKIKAAILTARDFGARLFAVFQPHGYGPTRFLKDELVDTFSGLMRPGDEVYFLPIYYAGGTVTRDVSAADLARLVEQHGVRSSAPLSREDLLAGLARRVKAGDVVLLMGARDPALSLLAREIRKFLEGRGNS